MQAEQFTRVARTYMDTVYRVALNYLKSPDSADDITQEVFLRLLRSQTEFASEEHMLEAAGEVAAPDAPDGAVADAVSRLPHEQREVIHLHYYEGYSTAEIAQILGSKQSTVCTQLERGRKLLKNMLLEANDD